MIVRIRVSKLRFFLDLLFPHSYIEMGLTKYYKKGYIELKFNNSTSNTVMSMYVLHCKKSLFVIIIVSLDFFF